MHEDKFKTFIEKEDIFLRVKNIDFENLKSNYPTKLDLINQFEERAKGLNYILTNEYNFFIYSLKE